MSMLAEPRRKQKVINLRAKNNAWSNDSNKFGQRMLEKMGWSSGKGLGAHENGIVEHVVAKYKNDDRGLGFEDKNDQWTKHEDDFNSLLANLSNSENNTENLPSGISLEVKSKKSKARIHYHKYTRGKDLSRYSERDLANIFGKKSFKEEAAREPLKEDVKASEQVFTEKGSMDDYFKNKLAFLKLKSNLFNKDRNDEDVTDYGFKGFSSTVMKGECESNDNSNNGFQPFLFYGTQPNNDTNTKDDLTSVDITTVSEQVTKKKKKKKSKCQDINSPEENCIELQKPNKLSELITDQEMIPDVVKKSKKKKIQDVDCDVTENINMDKKKKKKSREYTDLQNESECADTKIPKKKKKRKNKVE